jgi:hypothetical protein
MDKMTVNDHDKLWQSREIRNSLSTFSSQIQFEYGIIIGAANVRLHTIKNIDNSRQNLICEDVGTPLKLL